MDKVRLIDATSVYVIDQAFHIIYFNQALKNVYPEIETGMICYEVLCHERSQCANCPLRTGNQDNYVFLNKYLQQWISVKAAKTEWSDSGESYVIIANEQSSVERKIRNPMTGLYIEKSFYWNATEYLEKHSNEQHALIAVDIAHFKLFNEWYGREAGDEFLAGIAAQLLKIKEEWGGVAGYFGGDNFSLLIPFSEKILGAFEKKVINNMELLKNSAGFLPIFGVYMIEDQIIPVSKMYDRAVIALSFVQKNYSSRFCVFKPEMIEQMEKEQHLCMEAQEALTNGEFVCYFQPKYQMTTGHIIGVEAVVRWEHQTEGVIPPGGFVDILERNGYITKVDQYIWEQVCINLSNWIRKGHRAVPISMNVSRMDIFSMDVAKHFLKLVEKYDLDPALIEIEITESTYAENFQIVSNAVENLRKAGFRVLMDDFGSGYSSLNMLKSVSVDALKMDTHFLDMNQENADRGVSILESVVNMSKQLNLPVIVEGVETKEQVEFLRNMGCDYAQGFYFSGPVTVSEFENMLLNENDFEFDGIYNHQTEQIHVREILDDNLYSDTVMNRILGAVAFFEVSDKGIKIFRVNEQYLRIVGIEQGSEREQSLWEDLGNHISTKEQKQLQEMFFEAYRDRINGGKRDVHYFRESDSRDICLRFQVFFLRKIREKRVYYGSISDVTDDYQQREKENELNRKILERTLGIAGINSWDWNMEDQTLALMNTADNHRLAEIFPALGKERALLENFPNHLLTSPFVTDRTRNDFVKWLEEAKSSKTNVIKEVEFSLKNREGEILWISVSGELIRNEEGELIRMFGSYQDATDNKRISQESQEDRKILQMFRRQAEYDFQANLNQNRIKMGHGGERWRHEAGCSVETYTGFVELVSRKLVLEEFSEIFIEFTDRNRLIEVYDGHDYSEHMDYMKMRHGKPVWMRMVIHLTRFEGHEDIMAYIFVMNIDKQKKQELKLLEMAEKDALTGLYNRHKALPEMRDYLESSSFEDAALIMFDIDNLKQINDTLGHAYGDLMITTMANRIKKQFYGIDIVSRIGGDEFLVLCKNIPRDVVERKIQEIIRPMEIASENNREQLRISMSAGYVLSPKYGTDLHELYKKADMAMLAAKNKGKSAFLEYDVSIDEK